MLGEREERPVRPLYLRGNLTVQAELSNGHVSEHGYGASMHTDNVSAVAVAVSYVDGYVHLYTETEDGELTRLRVRGADWLRITDDAAGKLARSREQTEEFIRRQKRREGQSTS